MTIQFQVTSIRQQAGARPGQAVTYQLKLLPSAPSTTVAVDGRLSLALAGADTGLQVGDILTGVFTNPVGTEL